MKYAGYVSAKYVLLFIVMANIIGLWPVIGRINLIGNTNLSDYPDQDKSDKPLSLSLIVPSTFEDFQCFSQRLLAALYFEVLEPPNEVIFVVSSVPENISNLEHLEPQASVVIRIRVVYFHGVQNAARNRNIGGALAYGEIVSFFDIDDIPHPQRFAIIRSVFREHPGVQGAMFALVLGSYNSKQCFSFESVKVDQIRGPTCELLLTPCTSRDAYGDPTLYLRLFRDWSPHDNSTYWCCTGAHNWMTILPAPGWSSFRRDVFLKYRYNEALNIGEDGNMIARLIQNKENFTYWNIALGLYLSHAGRKELCGDDPLAFTQRKLADLF